MNAVKLIRIFLAHPQKRQTKETRGVYAVADGLYRLRGCLVDQHRPDCGGRVVYIVPASSVLPDVSRNMSGHAGWAREANVDVRISPA